MAKTGEPALHSPLRAGDKTLPDPCDAGFYVRYLDLCHRLGVEPSPPERVRQLVGDWNGMLKGATFMPGG